jgi:sugar phosphate isomerase/epimerase
MDRVRSAVPAEARGTGINFDISHFVAAGYAVDEMIRQLVPYSIHTHVKDGRMEDGKVRFLLPGEGDLDWAAYFRGMAQAGWTGPITVEVTAQIFNLSDYDPWPAAEFSLATLREARRAAGVR